MIITKDAIETIDNKLPRINPFFLKTNSILCFPFVIGKDKKAFQDFSVWTNFPSTLTFHPSLYGIEVIINLLSSVIFTLPTIWVFENLVTSKPCFLRLSNTFEFDQDLHDRPLHDSYQFYQF